MTLPSSMRAAVYKGKGQVVEEEIPLPQVGSGDLLIEISHCGICGSDLHFMVEDWARPDTVHGHEYSGTVVAAGDSVVGIEPGDLVVGGPRPGCGHCGPCGRGDTNLCTVRPPVGISHDLGAFAEYKVLPADSAFRIPGNVALRTAALTEPLAVALRGVRRAGVVEGSRVLVLGAGPIGLLTVASLRSAGVDQVTVRNLRIRGIDLEENLIMVEGAVPGPRDGYVLISKAKAPPRERRGFAGAGTVDPLKASKKASAGKKK